MPCLRGVEFHVRPVGGAGGGVLAEWLVLCARQAGWVAQATSVPGVAQRTGSTSYYIEWVAGGSAPVLALSPMPGRVDVVVASEWLETARMMERGFVTPELTTLIASTSRGQPRCPGTTSRVTERPIAVSSPRIPKGARSSSSIFFSRACGASAGLRCALRHRRRAALRSTIKPNEVQIQGFLDRKSVV